MTMAHLLGPATDSPESRKVPGLEGRPRGGVRLLTAADLHQRAGLYQRLEDAVERHQPDLVALVGDFLDVPGTGAGLLPVRECAHALARLPTGEIIFIRGNHEDMDWLTFADAWAGTGRRLHALHGESFRLGPLVVVGFPCLLGNDLAFTLGKPPLPPLDAWLPRRMRTLGPAGRTLWLMHIASLTP